MISLQGDVLTGVHGVGRFRYGVDGRPREFNWENLPRKGIFRRDGEAGISRAIKGEALA
jgi:hypothetical protein